MNSDEKNPEAFDQNDEPREIPFEEASVSKRYDDVFQVFRPNGVERVQWREGAYEFNCLNGVALRISVLADGLVRFRYSADGIFQPDFSYAVAPDFSPEKVRATLQDNPNEYILASERLQIVVSKTDLSLKIYDNEDALLLEDAEGFSAERSIMGGLRRMDTVHRSPKKSVYFGLGDKTCGVNLFGKKFEQWCTDSYGFGRETDPLYRAIPFYYTLRQGKSWGIFLDNSYRSLIDFNASEEESLRMSVEGGEMNFYFLYGPAPLEVSRMYARLTGTHELPPLWAMGYHQCRWSYYPDHRVLEVAERFRAEQIPCDALYLDIDYMDGYRCFTWNESYFPDPAGLTAKLAEKGFRAVVMIDPGIKEDPAYEVYREGMEEGYFVQTADGEVAKAPVWPGFCAFPDFTAPRVRKWWGELYAGLYNDLNIAGFWNDMNEPAVFHVNHKTLPDSVRHWYDGYPCSHKKAHNVYGMQMSRASWDGLKNLKPGVRPFLLGRAGYAGSQRFGAVWTGDNVADWEHLQIANIQCQRLAISGISFCGTDIGGFAGRPDGELYVRWLQLSVFHPLMRTHSQGEYASGDTVAVKVESAKGLEDQDPWSFGEKWTPVAKKAVELRYCLLPCIYTAMWQHHLDGTPVLRHMLFEDPADPKLWDEERDFLFGEHLLVSPVIQPKVHRQSVYLPAGTWYYFWTGQPMSGEVFVGVMPDQIPFFIREGAVLPVYPVLQWTGERPVEELTLYVYYKSGRETSHLYEDAGEGYDYKNGLFKLQLFETTGADDTFVLRKRVEGDYRPDYQRIKIYLVGFPGFVRRCTVDGGETPIKEIKLRERSLYTLTVSADFGEIVWSE